MATDFVTSQGRFSVEEVEVKVTRDVGTTLRLVEERLKSIEDRFDLLDMSSREQSGAEGVPNGPSHLLARRLLSLPAEGRMTIIECLSAFPPEGEHDPEAMAFAVSCIAEALRADTVVSTEEIDS